MELTLRIADIPLMLVLNDVEYPARQRITDWYANFVVSPQPVRVRVQIKTEPGGVFIALGSEPTYVIHTHNTNGVIDFESHYERGWVDLNSGRGELIIRPELGDPENFLRVVYAWLCLEQGSLLLHASGVIRNGQGFVFFGASGNGKTTLSRLSQDAIVLSDDMIIVRKYGDTFRACGVPFRGDFVEAPRTNAIADLRGLYRIIKDTEHSVESVPTAEAVSRLSACVPFVMRQPQNAARVLAVCQDLESHVPVQALHFKRDPGFWQVIESSFQINSLP